MRGGRELPDYLKTDYEKFLRRFWGRLEKLLDQCSGSCALRKPEVRKLVSDAVTFFDKNYAAVVMPNHCHVAIRPYEGHELENILQSWKSYTALQINRKLGISGEFWQGDSFDLIIRDEAHYRKVVRYILRNPVKAKLRVGEFWLRFGDRTW